MSDIQIRARKLSRQDMLSQVYADHSGQSVEKVEERLDRDFFMSPEEAQEFGLTMHTMGVRSEL